LLDFDWSITVPADGFPWPLISDQLYKMLPSHTERAAFLKDSISVASKKEPKGGEAMQMPIWLKSTKAFILDMDGTIYLGERLFPYTLGFLSTLEQLGKEYYFFTNNSSKPLAAYHEKLVGMGVPFKKHHLMNASEVMIKHLQDQGIRDLFIVGTRVLRQEFISKGFLVDQKPECVLVGFDTELDYEKVRVACDWIRAGVPVLGINPDLNCPVEGGMIPDCGSIGAMIESSTGVKIEYFGKPHTHTYDFVLERAGVREEEVVWIGDRLYTDIAITQNKKAHSILVLSGESTSIDIKNSRYRPDWIVPSLEELSSQLRLL